MNTKFKIATFCTGLLMMSAVPAFAQSPDDECQADADCPDNFICETVEWGACPGCEPGADECPPCETGSQNFCSPPPPAPCDDDNSCEGNNVCVTYTFEECSGGGSTRPSEPCSSEDPDDCGSSGGGDDRPSDPPECSTSEESYCVPPYLAPCSADADCGAGFTCETAEICSCSVGSDAAPGPDEDPAPPEDPDCTCEPSGHTYCQLIEVECTSDSDCVGDLTCQDYGGGGEDVPAGAPCMVDEDGNTDCGDPQPEPEPVDPKSYCAPPGYGYFGGVDTAGGYGESVANATGRDDATVTASEREEFFPVDGTDGDGDKQSPSGCSTASGGSGGSLLLLLAGLLLGRRRRRF